MSTGTELGSLGNHRGWVTCLNNSKIDSFIAGVFLLKHFKQAFEKSVEL